jgi:hypothetical protein
MSIPDTPLHHFDDAAQVSIDDFPFDDPAKEVHFLQTWHVLKTTEDPRARPSWWFFLLIGFAVAILFLGGGGFRWEQLGVLAGVVVLHELGHFIAMKAFGYTDGKLFFIPIFAALVRGRRHAAPAWQQAITILAGPLPGLLLGMFLYMTLRHESPGWMMQLVVLLAVINGINLLPLGFTDAGRLLNLIVYSRNAWIETMMQLVTAGIFGWLAFWQQNYLLGVLAVFMLFGAPMVFRMGQMTTRLRREGLQMPDTVAALEPLHGRMLFAATYDVTGRASPPVQANLMRQLHDRVLVPPPGLLATVGFLLVYLAGWLLFIGTAAMVLEDVIDLRTKIEAPHRHPEFRWKREADQLRGRARRLNGPAKDDALRQARELDRQYQAWRNDLKRQAEDYRQAFLFGFLPQPDEEEGEEDK